MKGGFPASLSRTGPHYLVPSLPFLMVSLVVGVFLSA